MDTMTLAEAIRDYAKTHWARPGIGWIHNQAEDIAAHVVGKLKAKPEPVLPPETYTASGLPRRAASRAREHGAKINLVKYGDEHQVDFPNGSRIFAATEQAAHRGRWKLGAIIACICGAAPDAHPPKGGTLEDVLNAFADAEEGR